MRTEEQISAYYEQLAIDYEGQAILGRYRASVHLENHDDEWYWDRMMQQYRPGKYNYIYYSLHHDGSQTSGCTQCMQFRNYLSSRFFICIDSDYRYLRKELNIDPEHYILQTYTYSWENHYCYAERLQEDLRQKHSISADIFDFRIFLLNYSATIYESLLLFLYMDRNNHSGFSHKKFNELSALQYRTGDLNNNGANVIQRLKALLSQFIAPLKIQYHFNLQDEKIYYGELGLTEENAYLHFRGHNLYNIVLSIGKHLCRNTDIDFEFDVLLNRLAFENYWEISKGSKDLFTIPDNNSLHQSTDKPYEWKR